MNLIKKATTTVRAKVTKYEISQDEEYDALLEKYKASKKNSLAIEKQLKVLSENIQGVGNSLQKLTQLFALEYDSSDVMGHHIAQLHQIMQQFQVQATEEFEQAIQKRCIAHVKNYCVALEGATKSIDTRDKTKYTFDDARYKLSQLIDSKKPVDQVKFKNYQHDLANQTATYNSVAYQCKKELYELVNARAHNATIAAFSESLSTFTQQTNRILSQSVTVAQSISQVPTYHDKYPEHRETVRPSELNQQPQAGFISSFNPSSFSTPNTTNSSSTSSITPSASRSPVPSEFDTEWFYLDKNVNQQGPVTFDQLRSLYKSGGVTASTHVFGGNLTDWSAISTVKNLSAYLSL